APSASAVMKPLSECQLYTFVDTACLHSRTPPEVAQQLCDGGSDLIQLRAKNSSPDEIRRMAETILAITAKAGVWLVINDHPQIAAEVGAAFCHLGQRSEEHTSELQSLAYLVCRLLLEKKKATSAVHRPCA